MKTKNYKKAWTTDRTTSQRMQQIGRQNTRPEQTVRKFLRQLGLRFSCNVPSLPGKPDVVFFQQRKSIFIHGCFWHRHSNCLRATMPKQNVKLWRLKFEKTLQRDRKHRNQLRRMGWKTLILWECELTPHNQSHWGNKIKKFINL